MTETNNNVKVCPTCNNINDGDASFCRICGNAIASEQQTNETTDNQPISAEPVAEQTENKTEAPAQNTAEQNNANADNNNTQSTTNYYNAQQNQNNYQQNNNTNYNQNYQSYNTINYNDEIASGVTVNEAAIFVGTAANTYIPKFIKKKMGKKAGLSPILLVFGLLFGTLVQSFWFFHRKMNKIGAIILAISIIFTAGEIILAANVITESTKILEVINIDEIVEKSLEEHSAQIDDDYSTLFGDDSYYRYDNPYGSDYTIKFDDLTNAEKEQVISIGINVLMNAVFIILLGIVNLIMAIIISVFGDYWYYNFTVKKIRAIKQTNSAYTNEDIAFAGSTQCFVWVIVLCVYIIATIAFSVFWSFSFLDTIINLTLL